MKSETYSLGNLVEISGAKHRSLQRWADRGVIEPLPSTQDKGTGVHRVFSRREAMVACLIHPFAERQIAIGELLAISVMIRNAIRISPEVFEHAISGEDDTILAYEGHKDKPHKGKWVHQVTLGQRAIFASRTTSWPDVVMAIRLESFLVKLA